jgi:hypothetical protein
LSLVAAVRGSFGIYFAERNAPKVGTVRDLKCRVKTLESLLVGLKESAPEAAEILRDDLWNCNIHFTAFTWPRSEAFQLIKTLWMFQPTAAF